MNDKEKNDYLEKRVYANITENDAGVLNISTYYRRKVSEMIGLDYDKLSSHQKLMLKWFICDENIDLELTAKKILSY